MGLNSFGDAGFSLLAAAVELGLAASGSEIGDPYANPKMYRLNALFDSLGRDLANDYDWPQLRKESSFTASSSGVALPGDFSRFVDGTVWKRSTAVQAIAVDSQEWQELQARNISGTLTPFFRIMDHKVYTLPSDGSTLYFEYQSSYWVDTQSSGAPDSDQCYSQDHTPWFDYQLLISGLKMRYARATGMPSAAYEQDFQDSLARAKAANTASRSVSLSHPSRTQLLSTLSIPDTGADT